MRVKTSLSLLAAVNAKPSDVSRLLALNLGEYSVYFFVFQSHLGLRVTKKSRLPHPLLSLPCPLWWSRAAAGMSDIEDVSRQFIESQGKMGEGTLTHLPPRSSVVRIPGGGGGGLLLLFVSSRWELYSGLPQPQDRGVGEGCLRRQRWDCRGRERAAGGPWFLQAEGFGFN